MHRLWFSSGDLWSIFNYLCYMFVFLLVWFLFDNIMYMFVVVKVISYLHLSFFCFRLHVVNSDGLVHKNLG